MPAHRGGVTRNTTRPALRKTKPWKRNHLAHYSSVGAAAAAGGDGAERNGRRGSEVAPGTERIMMVPWNSTADSARRQLDGSGVPVGLNKRARNASGAWCAAAVAPPPRLARARACLVALVPPRYPAPVFPAFPFRSPACTRQSLAAAQRNQARRQGTGRQRDGGTTPTADPARACPPRQRLSRLPAAPACPRRSALLAHACPRALVARTRRSE